MNTARTYADYAASAPLRPEASAAITAAFASGGANASSAHWEGARARAILETAREEVAALIGSHPLEIVFTSGATEANNLAVSGVAAMRAAPLTIAVPGSDHSSVLEPARALAAGGNLLKLLDVSTEGLVEAELAARAAPDLLSIGLVNAETGVIQDCAPLAAAAHAAGALVHVDAAQAATLLAIDVGELGADLLTLSGHKLGGPPGTGALYVRRGTPLAARALGGSQEHGLRAGTENVPAVAGFAAALAAAADSRVREAARLAELTDGLRRGIIALWPTARFAGDGGSTRPRRAAHVLNVAFPGLDGEALVAALDLEGIAVSAGSACTAGASEPSHVLLAMGRSREEARAAVRMSFGWASTTADRDRILAALPKVLVRARRRSEEAAWPVHAS